MNAKYDFFVAGRLRNKKNILKICDILDSNNKSYYCFVKDEESHNKAGLDLYKNENDLAEEFEHLELYSSTVRTIFESDLKAEKESENFLLVLPAGKSAHIEAGIAYGLGKKCYAIGEYDVTDSLYLIFEKIFSNEEEFKKFLKKEI